MNYKSALVVMAALAAACMAVPVSAQPSAPSSRWSADIGLGWDNGISGNVNSGAIGTLNNQVTVILPHPYDEVYGTGLHFRFGGGYLLDENTEARAMFTYQSLDANLVQLGDLGVSRLYVQYDPYKSFTLDVGLRRYFNVGAEWRLYTEGTIGLGFISAIDAVLSAPSINFTLNTTDFYDRTAAFTLGANAGVLYQINPRFGVYGQIGLRWMTGLSEVDNLVGTGLESINDNSSRWTVPVVFGTRIRF